MNRIENLLSRPPRAVLALTLTLSLVACDQKPAEQTQEAPPPAPAEAPATTALTSFNAFDASPLPAETTNKECALDTFNGEAPTSGLALPTGSSAAVGGWAGNGAGQVATGFHLVLKGAQSYSAPINIGVARPDVATSLNSPGLGNSGFTLDFSLANVAAGTYAAYITDPANPQTACDLKYSLTVQ
ncbi:hypothetical protein DSC_02450 [Pseudoxanthomonas spadix BD-a59]|uniref:Lipoprotein n=1 Tax=Pseudoxanthomonas spadix (strain BD-a59) TaxID=1045855 RepID=G7UVM6_PSEUP|nr:hypothetical protein [Pseudoxanthomonas spadix]AER55143.1 hypothetical protein DSC_02450 [Pseudoxanthomonas spadix BD-a59]